MKNPEDKDNQLIEMLCRLLRDERLHGYDIIDTATGEIIIPAHRTINITLLERLRGLKEFTVSRYQQESQDEPPATG